MKVDEQVKMLSEIASAANFVLEGMKETPGGDAYEYTGSMFNVEWLRQAVCNYEAAKIGVRSK